MIWRNYLYSLAINSKDFDGDSIVSHKSAMEFYLKISQVHVLFRILVESACFLMMIVNNYYQSLRVMGFPEL